MINEGNKSQRDFDPIAAKVEISTEGHASVLLSK